MARRARNNNRITTRHIELAESSRFHVASTTDIRRLRSWDDALEFALAEIDRRGIVVQTKRRGFINWRRFSERATMLPAKHGPMLLPWDWSGRSTRSKARTLIHELGHHEEDAKIPWYEALYLHKSWMWGLEMTLFGQELRLMVASDKLGWASPYTKSSRDRYIQRLSGKVHKSYGMGRRYSRAEVRSESERALKRHLLDALKAFS